MIAKGRARARACASLVAALLFCVTAGCGAHHSRAVIVAAQPAPFYAAPGAGRWVLVRAVLIGPGPSRRLVWMWRWVPDIVASPPIYVPPSARSDYVQPPTAQTTAPAAAFVDNPQAQSTDMPSTPDDHTDRDEYDADDLIGYWAIKVQHSGLFGYGEGCVQNVSVVADKIEWLVGKLVTSLRNEPEQEKTFKDAARDAVITLVEKFGNAALAVKLCDPALAQQTMQRHPEWTPR